MKREKTNTRLLKVKAKREAREAKKTALKEENVELDGMMPLVVKTTHKFRGNARKKTLEKIASHFPITKDTLTGDEVDTDVTEIAKLRFIPGKFGETVHYFEGLVLMGKGNKKDKVITPLNPDWVEDVFTRKFVNFVMRAARISSVPVKTWIDVPVGQAREDDAPPPSLETDILVKYMQGQHNTCLYRGFASALHHLGDTVLAHTIAVKSTEYTELPAAEQLNRLCQEVESRYQVIKYMTKKKASSIDILRVRNRHATVIIPLAGDGGVQHAITVVGDILFDSTQTHALVLSQATLDWCCDNDSGFTHVFMAVTFVPFGEPRNFAKYTVQVSGAK